MVKAALEDSFAFDVLFDAAIGINYFCCEALPAYRLHKEHLPVPSLADFFNDGVRSDFSFFNVRRFFFSLRQDNISDVLVSGALLVEIALNPIVV